MHPETLPALLESIAHWERNATAETPSDASVRGSSCALCAVFYTDSGCAGCPVEEATGQNYCIGSPWLDASISLSCWRANKYANDARSAFRTAARDEVDFLRGLLPATEQAGQAVG